MCLSLVIEIRFRKLTEVKNHLLFNMCVNIGSMEYAFCVDYYKMTYFFQVNLHLFLYVSQTLCHFQLDLLSSFF